MNPHELALLAECIRNHTALQASVWDRLEPEMTVVFPSKILDMFEHQMLIGFPMEEVIVRALMPGRVISLEYQAAPEESFKLITVVNALQRKEPIGCWVELPPGAMSYFKTLRRHVRVSARLPLQVGFQGEKLACESIDLSGGGMRFFTARPFIKDETLQISLQPDALGQDCALDAEVVHCHPAPVSHGARGTEYIVAVRFVNLTRALEDRLVGLCFRKELEQKRHLK